MNVTRMTDEELMSFEPTSLLQAQTIAAELHRRADAQFREADQLERWGRSRRPSAKLIVQLDELAKRK